MKKFKLPFAAIICIVVLLCCALQVGAAKDKTRYFSPDALERFDGITWSSLTIASGTRAGVMAVYKTAPSDLAPEALTLVQPDASPYKVDVYFNGRTSKSTITGFRLQYLEEGPDLSVLSDQLEKAPEIFFTKERFSDWHVEIFSNGIVALVQQGNTPVVWFTTVKRAKVISDMLTAEQSEIQDYQAKADSLPKAIAVGNINTDIVTAGLVIPNVSKRKDAVVKRLKSELTKDNAYVLQDGVQGAVKAVIKVDYTANRGGTVSVDIALNAANSLGNIAANGNATADLPKDKAQAKKILDSQISKCFAEALTALKDDSIKVVAEQKTPTADEFALTTFEKMVEKAIIK